MTNWFAGVATLIVGFFAGWVSMRVSRKLPHERLKQLVDIRGELGELDTDGVIEAAIMRELRLLKRLNTAREVSQREFTIEWVSQNTTSVMSGLLAVTLADGAFLIWLHGLGWTPAALVAFIMSTVIVVIVTCSAIFVVIPAIKRAEDRSATQIAVKRDGVLTALRALLEALDKETDSEAVRQFLSAVDIQNMLTKANMIDHPDARALVADVQAKIDSLSASPNAND